MQLDGKQFERICNALAAAFPSRDKLKQMVRFDLNENLDQIANNQDLTATTFDLVTWAERNDQVKALIEAAHKRVENNPALKALMAEYAPPPEPAATNTTPSETLPKDNLPAKNVFFTGRTQLLADLHQELSNNKVAVLSGLGGIGKTQTALAYAYRHLDEYGFIGWLNAEDPSQLQNDFVSLSPLLGLEAHTLKEVEQTIEAVKWELAQRSDALLIFDNVEETSLIEAYLPPRWRGQTLITSRNPVWHNARDLPLENFTLSEAQAFLQAHLDADNPDSLRILLAELGGLPLALEHARAYMQQYGRNVSAYLRFYRQHRARLLADIPTHSQAQRTVAATWTIALERVAEQVPASTVLLNLCAFFAPDKIPYRVFVEGAAHLPDELAVLVEDEFAFEHFIQVLRQHSLVKIDGETLSFHRLVQMVLYERLNVAQQTEYLVLAITLLQSAFNYTKEDMQTWQTSAPLVPHIHALAEKAQQCSFTSGELGQLLNRAGSYLLNRSEFQHSKLLLEQSLAIHTEVHGQQHAETAKSLSDMGILFIQLGEYELGESYCQQALQIRVEILGEEHTDTAISFANLALLFHDQGKYNEAKFYYEQALQICRATLGDNHVDTAAIINALALTLQKQGVYSQAKSYFEQALAIRRTILGNKHPTTAVSLNNLGYYFEARSEYTEAKPYFEEALKISQRILGYNNNLNVSILNNLSTILISEKNYSQAQQYLEQALAIQEKLLGKSHPDIAIVLNNLAKLHADQGQNQQAITYSERALAMHEAILGEEHPDIVGLLSNLGVECERTAQFTKAKHYFNRVLRVHEKYGYGDAAMMREVKQRLNKFSHGSGKRSGNKRRKKRGK